MGTPAVTQRQGALLDALAGSSRPMTIQELADLTGRHPTTVRAHLKELEDGALVRSAPLRDGARGRPRLVWFAVRTPDASLADLAVVLAQQLAGREDEPSAVAYELGRRMARRRTERMDDLALEMSRLGFDARLDDDDPRTMWLHACPYLRAATAVPEVTCPMHEGLIDALTEDSTELRDHRAHLDPLVGPGVCRMRLVRRADR